MAALTWHDDGKSIYHTGVKNCALYVVDDTTQEYGEGIAWNGITAVTESPSGAEVTSLYADDKKYINLVSAEEFGASIEAYMYPPEFEECDGTAELAPGVGIGQQSRKKFGLAYLTTVGNDKLGDKYGEIIHLIYNCTASPSEKGYQTISDSPEAITFSWELSTTPKEETVNGKTVSTATVTIDSTKFEGGVTNAKYVAIKQALYGSSDKAPTLLSLTELFERAKTA